MPDSVWDFREEIRAPNLLYYRTVKGRLRKYLKQEKKRFLATNARKSDFRRNILSSKNNYLNAEESCKIIRLSSVTFIMYFLNGRKTASFHILILFTKV